MAKHAAAKPGKPAKAVGGSLPGSSASAAEAIPDKLYFRIGEVAELCGVETYVLRFWQTEFPQLAPKKSGTGQRLYRRRDVEQALRIKRLLHDEGYTIAGARGVFATEAAESAAQRRSLKTQPELALAPPVAESVEARQAREQLDRAADRAQVRLARMRLELRELHTLLSSAPASATHASTYPQHRPQTRSYARAEHADEALLFVEESGDAGS